MAPGVWVHTALRSPGPQSLALGWTLTPHQRRLVLRVAGGLGKCLNSQKLWESCGRLPCGPAWGTWGQWAPGGWRQRPPHQAVTHSTQQGLGTASVLRRGLFHCLLNKEVLCHSFLKMLFCEYE